MGAGRHPAGGCSTVVGAQPQRCPVTHHCSQHQQGLLLRELGQYHSPDFCLFYFSSPLPGHKTGDSGDMADATHELNPRTPFAPQTAQNRLLSSLWGGKAPPVLTHGWSCSSLAPARRMLTWCPEALAKVQPRHLHGRG